MLYNAPLSAERAERLMGRMSINPGDRVLDVGCGTGAFLRQFVKRSGCEGLGLDINPESVAVAKSDAAAAGLRLRCLYEVQDVNAAELPESGFGAVICIGSTHAFTLGALAYEAALRGIHRLLRPGGVALIGEGYWKQPPPEAYLSFLGANPGIYRDHKGNVDVGESMGFIPLYCVVSNEDEWDDFEWSHRHRIEVDAAANPEDPEVQAALVRSRRWRDAYLQWGRQAMGFGFYLFQRPLIG